MAKKQSLSYSPNMGLIAGEAAVAESEAARTSLGGQAFTQNLSASVIGMIDEEKKRKAEMQAWMTDLGSVDNINKLDQNYNKQAVTDFVRSGRDEFAKLAAIYKKTGNLDVMDKMNDIKYSFQNLNNQLENLQQDRKTYIDQFNKGKIVTIKGDEKYTDIYTNKGQFKIEENGDIGFSHGENGGVYSKFNDIAGKWNPDNSIYGKEFLTTDSQEVARAQKGDQFDARGVRNRLGGLLNQQSWQEVQVAFMQDIIGDDEMELEDGRTAGNMSFQALWSTGQLDKKFYEGFKAESNGTYNTDWMFEKENRSLGTKLKAMYDTDVIESRHEDMFKAKDGGGGGGEDKMTQTQLARADGWTGLYVYTEPSDGDVVPEKIEWTVAVRRRNQLNNFEPISGQHDSYKWNPDLNPPSYENSKGKAMSLYEVAKDEGLIRNGEGKGDFNFKKIAKTNEDKEYLDKNEAPPSFLKDYGDSDASSKLNEQFNLVQGTQGGKFLDGGTDYYFVPWSSQAKVNGEYSLSGGDNVLTNDIMLVDITSGKAMPVLNEEGKIRRFGTGEDFKQDDLNFINNLLKDYAGKKEIDPLDNNQK